MKSSQRRALLIIGGAAILALAVVVLLRPDNTAGGDSPDHAQPTDTMGQPDGDQAGVDGGADGQADVDGQPADPPTPPAGDDLQPEQLYELGLRLMADGKFVQARSALSRALFSQQLAADQADDARTKLGELANETLFEQQVDGDPYTFLYVVQPRDTLQQIERDLELHVPYELIMHMNGIDDARRIEADDTLVMIRGPFHAVVNKSDFTMDIYLHREGLEKIFITRLAVGLGRDNVTPAGMWQVKLGGKARRPTWYPPPRSDFDGPIQYGEPNYPFGKLGLWIPLVGLDEDTEQFRGYGIHSTSQPHSIGRQASLGCIRLADEDIKVVFTLLYEKWSTVEVRP